VALHEVWTAVATCHEVEQGGVPSTSGYVLCVHATMSVARASGRNEETARCNKAAAGAALHLGEAKAAVAAREHKRRAARAGNAASRLVWRVQVALKSQSRVTYNVKLSIGSPPQPLEVIFDTGLRCRED
jgi:hypothetical protein